MDEFKELAEDAMKDKIASLKGELNGIRTGRADPHMLEPVKVDYYGSPVPVKQVAAVSAQGRTLEIRPWDPSVLEELEKALQKADLGAQPQNDGKCIRINFPAMTEDRRKEMAKTVGKIGEKFRVSVRADRKEALEAIRDDAKKNSVSEDIQKRAEDGIQKLTDAYIKQIDELVEAKQTELSTI